MANGIVVYDGNVYIAGEVANGDNIVAGLYITTADGNNPQKVILDDTDTNSTGQGLTGYNDCIFIVGSDNSGENPIARLYVYNLTGPTKNTYPIYQDPSEASCITRYNQTFFVGGQILDNFDQIAHMFEFTDPKSVTSYQVGDQDSVSYAIDTDANNRFIGGKSDQQAIIYKYNEAVSSQVFDENSIIVDVKVDEANLFLLETIQDDEGLGPKILKCDLNLNSASLYDTSPDFYSPGFIIVADKIYLCGALTESENLIIKSLLEFSPVKFQ